MNLKFNLHRLPDFSIFVTDGVVPDGQFGTVQFRHRIVQAHILPNPDGKRITCYYYWLKKKIKEIKKTHS